MKCKKILSDRKDSNGNRFIGIINAFYIAKQCNQKPMFTWDAVSKAHLLVEDYKNFNKQRFISNVIDTKENIFSKNFIQEHCLTYEDKSSLSLATDEKFRYLKKFKNYILNTNYDYYEITRTEDYIKDIWKDLDICDYIQRAAEIFNNINFTEKVANIVKQAHLKATELKNANGGGGINSLSHKSWRHCVSFCKF